MGATSTKQTITVFIASPGDVAKERRAFKDQLERLNLGFGDGANIEFKPLGWEDALPQVARRSQELINQDIDACDVFVLVLHRRWGQEAPDSDYSSYTEEEFYRALERWKRDAKPCILVYLKSVEPDSMADPGPQLAKVLSFRRELEETRQVIAANFEGTDQFATMLDGHLRRISRDDFEGPSPTGEPLPLPVEAVEKVRRAESAKAKAESEAERLRRQLEEMRRDTATDASGLALEGRIEAARQKFAKAIDGTTDLQVLYLAYEFYSRIGELDSAVEMLEQWLAISGKEAESADTAAAYGNLGNVYQVRGDLAEAESMYRKSLAIEEKLGRPEGMASDYGNLGNVYRVRGDLDEAESMYRKALELNEKLGRPEGMANQYGNLGNVYQVRGDLAEAESMYRKSLAIKEKLGRPEGMASDYGNLGNVYHVRGDLDEAESMHRKSLELNEKLGRPEGMASDYGNLGNVYRVRGDLDEAESMYRKSLAIEEKLGRLEGMASDYGNIGSVYNDRRDMAEACRCWRRALELFERVGARPQVEQVRGWIDAAGCTEA